MTEEEFKKTMAKTIFFIVFAVIILIVIGYFVFNKSGKEVSIFSSQQEIDAYKKKVQEVNSKNQEELNIVDTELNDIDENVEENSSDDEKEELEQ